MQDEVTIQRFIVASFKVWKLSKILENNLNIKTTFRKKLRAD
jgi:hypothetical protein